MFTISSHAEAWTTCASGLNENLVLAAELSDTEFTEVFLVKSILLETICGSWIFGFPILY